MTTEIHADRRRVNEKCAALINEAWGEKVAWVEDQFFDVPPKGSMPGYRGTLPVVKSILVGGCLDGKPCPPFSAAAIGKIK